MTEPSNSKVIVEAEGIVKVLGSAPNEIKVLKGIDLQLHTGELTLMMGPSGSGKTTLLSVLGCILSPTQGKLSISGMKTHNMSKEQLANLRRKHVGFVFQSYNLVPTLSAVENVMLALDLRDLNGPDAYDQAAEFSRSRRARPPHQRHAFENVGWREAARFDCPRPRRLTLGHSGRRADGGTRRQERHGGHGIARKRRPGHPPGRSRGHP